MPRLVKLTANYTDATWTKIKVDATGFMGRTTMELPLTLGQFQQGIESWDRGAYVQDAFPTLNAGQREFLMTGMNEMQFDKAFPEDEEDA